MKWIAVVVLVIIGVLAAVVAVEYLTVSIHSLPSFIPGRKHVPGHYHKRGAIAAVIALIAFAGAAVLAVRFRRQAPAPAVTSAGDLLSGPGSTPGPPPAS